MYSHSIASAHYCVWSWPETHRFYDVLLHPSSQPIVLVVDRRAVINESYQFIFCVVLVGRNETAIFGSLSGEVAVVVVLVSEVGVFWSQSLKNCVNDVASLKCKGYPALDKSLHLFLVRKKVQMNPTPTAITKTPKGTL